METTQEDEGQADGGQDGGSGKLKHDLAAAQSGAAGEAPLPSHTPHSGMKIISLTGSVRPSPTSVSVNAPSAAEGALKPP